MRRSQFHRGAWLFVPALGACLAAPEADLPRFEPMCTTSADCDSGKTCDIGICWGDPPARAFAATLLPPAGRADLAPTEIRELDIDSAGNVDNLVFAETALVAGRVLLDCGQMPTLDCDPTRSIAARVTFSRPSLIPGQPAYTRSVTSAAGRPAGETSFSVALPLADMAYQVAVVPAGNTQATGHPLDDPPALAPPSHFALVVDRDMQVEWRLGAPAAHKVVTGRVVDLLQSGIANMRVFALESQAPALPDERISSIVTTGEDGAFSLRLPLAREQPFDLVAVPVDDSRTPALRAFDKSAPAAEPTDIGVMVMPGYGQAVSYTVPVRGIDGNGDEVPIGGATVRVTTLLGDSPEDTVAIFSTLGYTDELGNARLQLLPPGNMQNRRYLADIEPLGGSQHAILHGHVLDVGTDASGVLETIRLARRIAVSGQVYTADGVPAVASTVEARLSEVFRQGLDPDDRARIDSLQLPSTTTDQSGRFVLWLDASLAAAEAVYDLRLLPAHPLAPRWSVRGVRMGQQTQFTTVEIGTITLPRGSYARGTVRDRQGAPVSGAELRWFELLSDAAACGVIADQPCQSVFRGLYDTGDDGWVMLVLPE